MVDDPLALLSKYLAYAPIAIGAVAGLKDLSNLLLDLRILILFFEETLMIEEGRRSELCRNQESFQTMFRLEAYNNFSLEPIV